MKDNKPKDRANMGPPRLTLVPKDDNRAVQSEATESPLPPLAESEAGPLPPLTEAAAHVPAPLGAEGQAAVGEPLPQTGPAQPAEPADPVAVLAAQDRREKLRIIEAVLFAASEPMSEAELARSLIEGDDVAGLLAQLQDFYAPRGINLVKVAGKWAFRTAGDLSFLLQRYAHEERRLSKAALETLAIIAYHQPVTRAEIEEIRGVSTSAGTIDILMETRWIRPRGRRRAPGRPVTYGTTEHFLEHFGLDTIKDLPGLAELKGAGLLDATLPPGFSVPEPSDIAALMPDELPLEDADDDDAQGALAFDDHAGEEPADVGDDAGDAAVTAATPGADDTGATGDLPGDSDLETP